MTNKKERFEQIAAKAKADDAFAAGLREAVEKEDVPAIMALAAEHGIELEESDFEPADGRALDDGELEAVAGGHKPFCHNKSSKIICVISLGSDYYDS